jgi:feruloyl-CoA synthase
LSENFKLSSGTWVSVGSVRLGLVDACAPLLLDAVIAGHDREALGALLLPSPAGTRDLPEDEVRLRIFRALEKYNHAHQSSSTCIHRALILTRPLSLDDGETTDKGYTNQRRVLEHRSQAVERLFAQEPDPDVFVFDTSGSA